MLNTINCILKENNLVVTQCSAKIKRTDGVITLTATCHFQGKIIFQTVPIINKFLADFSVDTEKVTFLEEANYSMVRFLGSISELPAMTKHFAELYSGWKEVEIEFDVNDGELDICSIKTGYSFGNGVAASATAVRLRDSNKQQTCEIYTYDGWNGFMATEFKDIMGELEAAQEKERVDCQVNFAKENTYRFTVMCPNGAYYYITKPRAWASKRDNDSAERFMKAFVGWKHGVEHNQKGLITFYDYILKDFISCGESVHSVAVKDAKKYYRDGYGKKLMPEHYENFVITKMEKLEIQDKFPVWGITKVRKMSK